MSYSEFIRPLLNRMYRGDIPSYDDLAPAAGAALAMDYVNAVVWFVLPPSHAKTYAARIMRSRLIQDRTLDIANRLRTIEKISIRDFAHRASVSKDTATVFLDVYRHAFCEQQLKLVGKYKRPSKVQRTAMNIAGYMLNDDADKSRQGLFNLLEEFAGLRPSSSYEIIEAWRRWHFFGFYDFYKNSGLGSSLYHPQLYANNVIPFRRRRS